MQALSACDGVGVLMVRTTLKVRGTFVLVSIPESLITEIDKILEKEKLDHESRPVSFYDH